MKICVIIPVYNEADTIGSLVDAIKKKGLDIIVIDDGSTDNSGKIAFGCGAEVIKHGTRKGKGASLKDGFRYVLERDYEGAITMDGDGQHDPQDLDAFLSAINQHGVCVINGNRMNNVHNMPFVRRKTNQFMSFLISSVIHFRIPDTQCGYRYIHRSILKQLQLVSNDFEIETEILMKACKQGFAIHSVPVKTIYRNEKSKINPAKDTWRFFKYFIKELLGK